MKTRVAVVGTVKFGDKILFLKRSHTRSSSPNKWQVVSGYIKEKELAEEAILREVKEETGLEGEIVKSGKAFEVIDDWGRWINVPFLISVDSDKVKIDLAEHSEYMWIRPENISKFDCVASIDQDLKSVGLL